MNGLFLGIVLVGLGIGLLLLIVFLVRAWLFGRFIVGNFRRCNVVVDGKKGKGKDLLFQYVIAKRKAPYYANIDYGGRYENIKVRDIDVSPNTYREFIADHVSVVKRKMVERKDVYISDGGIYLPSYMDSQLYKAYPSFPIYYALSRHLADSNVHVNVQNVGRLWKALREQADFFVHIKTNVKIPFFILVKCWTYDNVNSAMACVAPVKTRLFNKFSKAETDVYNAQYGEMRSGWVIIPKWRIKYNTRALEPVLYGEQPRILEEGTD